MPSQIISGFDHGFTLTDQFQRDKISDSSAFHLNEAMNEIGYTFKPSNRDRLFWSLPKMFTGNQIKSYGGSLEFNQRYMQRPQASYNIDQDVIVTGNGITIYWTNPVQQHPDIINVCINIKMKLYNTRNTIWYFLFAESLRTFKSECKLATYRTSCRHKTSFTRRHIKSVGKYRRHLDKSTIII